VTGFIPSSSAADSEGRSEIIIIKFGRQLPKLSNKQCNITSIILILFLVKAVLPDVRF